MLLAVYAMPHRSQEKNLYKKYKMELAVEITDAPATFKFL